MNMQAKFSYNAARTCLFSCFAALALISCTSEPARQEEPPLAGATIGGEFELEGPGGEMMRWADFDGQYRIVYFGYTFCPDICPTDVQRMTQGLKQVSENDPEMAKMITPVFITIDPERDTRAVVDEFTAAFSDRLIGLTGSPDQVRSAADAFKVYYERGADVNDTYLMNHSNIVYLFDPEGQPLATLPVDEGAEAVAQEIKKWVN